MSAGFRSSDSRGKSLLPGRSANKTSSSNKNTRTSLGSFLSSSSSPKYHRLQQDYDNVNHFHRTYVLGHVDSSLVDDEDDEVDVFELPEIRSRKGQGSSKSPDSPTSRDGPPEDDYPQHVVADGDTVQSLSIKYSCPISELKRVNHLIRDQDLFGLKLVKVPIKKYGITTDLHRDSLFNASETTALSNAKLTLPQLGSIDGETIATTEIVESSTDMESPTNNHDDRCNLSDPDTQRRVIQSLSIKDMMHSQTKEAEEFLRSMDRDLEILRESTRTSRHSLDEVISVLTNKSIQPLNRGNSMCGGSGNSDADCGLRYKNIVAALLVIGVVLPVLFLLYYKYLKPD